MKTIKAGTAALGNNDSRWTEGDKSPLEIVNDLTTIYECMDFVKTIALPPKAYNLLATTTWDVECLRDCQLYHITILKVARKYLDEIEIIKTETDKPYAEDIHGNRVYMEGVI